VRTERRGRRRSGVRLGQWPAVASEASVRRRPDGSLCGLLGRAGRWFHLGHIGARGGPPGGRTKAPAGKAQAQVLWSDSASRSQPFPFNLLKPVILASVLPPHQRHTTFPTTSPRDGSSKDHKSQAFDTTSSRDRTPPLGEVLLRQACSRRPLRASAKAAAAQTPSNG
jgi:hypothetical protein